MLNPLILYSNNLAAYKNVDLYIYIYKRRTLMSRNYSTEFIKSFNASFKMSKKNPHTLNVFEEHTLKLMNKNRGQYIQNDN